VCKGLNTLNSKPQGPTGEHEGSDADPRHERLTVQELTK
jgi:hypothetical protein